MKDLQKRIHNVVASIVLSSAMRQLKNEFMVCIRGYLNANKKDTDLLIRAEHAARKSMEAVLMERDSTFVCPCCGAQLDSGSFDKGNGGDQNRDSEGFEYQNWSAVCQSCGKTVYQAYRYIGTYTEEEYKNIMR